MLTALPILYLEKCKHLIFVAQKEHVVRGRFIPLGLLTVKITEFKTQ
jgi:hypothetical protein